MTLTVTRFIVLRRIAISGPAETLLAFQGGLAGLEKLVVIKRALPGAAADNTFRQAFIEGARRALSLRHPHLVELYEVNDEGEPYVVMEYISGEDLRYLLGRAQGGEIDLPLGVACRVVAQVADALHLAHTAADPDGHAIEALHLGVDPGNIMVGYTGAAKLLDLGLARADLRDSHRPAGGLRSALAYRSPERIEGRALDARSDVYSLGVVCYELLAQKRLFTGESDSAVCDAVLHMPVPPLGAARPDIPPGLEALVRCALERDPHQRPASAQEFRQQLEECLAAQRLYVGDDHIAQWMQTVLVERWAERRAVERAAIVEARQRASSLVPLTAEVPVLLSGPFGTGEMVAVQTGSGAGLVLPAVASGMQSSSPSRRRLVLLGSLTALVLLALLALAFYLGSGGDEPFPVEVSMSDPVDSVEVTTTEDPRTLCRVARAQHETGESQAALQTLRRARQIAAPEAQDEINTLELEIRGAVKIAHARQLIAEGQQTAARRELELLLAEQPNHADARALLLSLAGEAAMDTGVVSHKDAPGESPRAPERRSTRRGRLARRGQRAGKRAGPELNAPRPPPQAPLAAASAAAAGVAETITPPVASRAEVSQGSPGPSEAGFGIDADLSESEEDSPPRATPAPKMPPPAPPATAIRVISDIPGLVAINGRSLNKKTPVKLLLKAGTYEISVRLDGLDVEIKRRVTVAEGKTVTLRLRGKAQK